MSDTLKAYPSRNVPRYTSYPTAPHLSKDFSAKSYADWLISLPAHEPISLYLHVPFCRELCWYCGCNMKLAKRDEPVAAYAKILVKEVELLAQHLLILSSLAEVMLKRERKAIADLFAMEKPAIEVNNAAGLLAFGDARTSEVYTRGAQRSLLAAEGMKALATLDW
ncbi:oxygen-independent coproporphyrinogen III oxidase [Cochlodiniinecator piscidefendens]|uniref:hypothetical protein n=1 Tax=Cochlodiniinecator piscidefendens TaxID=2715756 RepID=UPI001E3C27B0|nr:hypothetical protein [Cochlodiniinecator piscidefendens]